MRNPRSAAASSAAGLWISLITLGWLQQIKVIPQYSSCTDMEQPCSTLQHGETAWRLYVLWVFRDGNEGSCVPICVCVQVCVHLQMLQCECFLWCFAAEKEHAGFYNQDSGITLSPCHQSDLSWSHQTAMGGGGRKWKDTWGHGEAKVSLLSDVDRKIEKRRRQRPRDWDGWFHRIWLKGNLKVQTRHFCFCSGDHDKVKDLCT